jgi:hypothetical protein
MRRSEESTSTAANDTDACVSAARTDPLDVKYAAPAEPKMTTAPPRICVRR